MPVVLAGASCNVSVDAGQSLLVCSELAAAVVANGATLVGSPVPSLGARAVAYGPVAVPTQMTVTAGASNADYEVASGNPRTTKLVELSSSVATLRVPSLARAVLQAYRTRVVAAADTVDDTVLEVLEPILDRLMHTSVWPKLRELWMPASNAFAGSLVKLKSDATAGTSMTHTALVAGDYTRQTGITGNGTTKIINTGFNPTTAGVTQASWGFGAYQSAPLAPTGIVAGTSSGTGSYIAYSVSNTSNFNQQAAGSHVPYAGFNAVQQMGGVASTWTGGYAQSRTAVGAGTLDNSAITLLSAGGGFFSNATVCGWAAWTPGLTDAEMRELTSFFDAANAALWRAAWQPVLTLCGDSNTVGFGLGTPAVQRFGAILAGYLGFTEDNQGLSSTSMSNNDDGGAAARWVSDFKISASLARRPHRMVCMFGTNDDRYRVSTANFLEDYDTWLRWQIAGGIDAAQILLLSQPATTDALSRYSVQREFSLGVQSLAAAYGCGFFDVHALTTGQPSYLQGDSLHLSVAGHAAVAPAIRDYIVSTLPAGPLRRNALA